MRVIREESRCDNCGKMVQETLSNINNDEMATQKALQKVKDDDRFSSDIYPIGRSYSSGLIGNIEFCGTIQYKMDGTTNTVEVEGEPLLFCNRFCFEEYLKEKNREYHEQQKEVEAVLNRAEDEKTQNVLQ